MVVWCRKKLPFWVGVDPNRAKQISRLNLSFSNLSLTRTKCAKYTRDHGQRTINGVSTCCGLNFASLRTDPKFEICVGSDKLYINIELMFARTHETNWLPLQLRMLPISSMQGELFCHSIFLSQSRGCHVYSYLYIHNKLVSVQRTPKDHHHVYPARVTPSIHADNFCAFGWREA